MEIQNKDFDFKLFCHSTGSLNNMIQFSSVQLLIISNSLLTARQASLSITNSQSLLKLTSIESVMPSHQLILSSPFRPAFNLSQHQGLFK